MTKSVVVLIIGNSKSTHLGAQGTCNPTTSTIWIDRFYSSVAPVATPSTAAVRTHVLWLFSTSTTTIDMDRFYSRVAPFATPSMAPVCTHPRLGAAAAHGLGG